MGKENVRKGNLLNKKVNNKEVRNIGKERVDADVCVCIFASELGVKQLSSKRGVTEWGVRE